MKKFILTCLAPIALWGCDDRSDFEKQQDALFKHVASRIKGPFGSDYWIEKQGQNREWIKTGLIFGHLGNDEVCLSVIDGLKSRYADEFRCIPAN